VDRGGSIPKAITHLNSLLSCLNVDTMNRNLGSMLIIVDAIQVVAK
jgi:hypothetical protein